ncbi:exodeoxyribonuclease VII large subunit [Desulfospira joergensenii]|uniref:exodeoxyribonuclease VII large subunit n=1 Tax=Desulfospira joergensenii TaxID=53329 RepID=UPI0003B6E0B6|nr:exodeoxyribonuclease VII large subunit [Desulfospira joergensenii]
MAAEKNNGNIYTVSNLTREIKSLLENKFPFVWIIGEISNYAVPVSGHSYFSLKDAKAVVNCVMFKNQKTSLKFNPENGLKVIGLARLSLYEPRGAYQLIFEHMEPEGAGSLQLAFEQLKKKLFQEGLFDAAHKKEIPFLPLKINLITSGTGAAVRDIIKVANRRLPLCRLELLPVKVQGEGADREIAHALELANRSGKSDLIILARGGGSMEDLAAFNSEVVARAIFESNIPVITGVGHETDFTIADFVADLRAPTPSAAAESALPDKKNLIQILERLEMSMVSSMNQRLGFLTNRIHDLESRLKSPRRTMDDYRFRLEELESRMMNSLENQLFHKKEKLSWACRNLNGSQPQVEAGTRQLKELSKRMGLEMKGCLDRSRTRLDQLEMHLSALSPESVLDRGYSIVQTLPEKTIAMDAGKIQPGTSVEVFLSKGRLMARVEDSICE